MGDLRLGRFESGKVSVTIAVGVLWVYVEEDVAVGGGQPWL